MKNRGMQTGRDVSRIRRRFGVGAFLILALAAFSTAVPVRGDKETIGQIGDVIQILLPVGGAGYAAYIGDTEGFNQYVYSFGTSWSMTYALKFTVRRVRPSFSNDQSFPSGHTMGAFSGASFIQRRYGEKMGAWQWTPYLLAGFVGWSRVYSEAHHVGDAATGVMMGVVPTYTFTTPFGTKGQIRPYGSTSGGGISMSASLPTGGASEPFTFRNVLKWPGFGYAVDEKSIFEDPYDITRSNRTRTGVSFDSDVLSLDKGGQQIGWIIVSAGFDWEIAPNHLIRIWVPYVESDLPSIAKTVGGIGDVRVGYRWAAHDARDPTAMFQGITLGLDLSLPTGSEVDSLGAGTNIWAPTVEGAFSFFDGYVGFNPAFTYVFSDGATTARSMTTDGLFRPGLYPIELPVEMRASILELPFTWRVSDRWTVGGGATMSHDSNRDDGTSWMGNLMVGFKISERTTWRFDYGERLAGPDPIFGRFRMRLAVFF